MEKWCLFLILAFLSDEALGFSYRTKRQAESAESSTQGDLEDRYGWNRPIWQGGWPRPVQGQFPGQGQFPDQGQLPEQGQNQLPGQGQNPTPSPPANAPTTQSSTIQECIKTCLVTSEYNPVCGSNGVTYENNGRLLCAQACGVNVNLVRASRCPPTTVPAN